MRPRDIRMLAEMAKNMSRSAYFLARLKRRYHESMAAALWNITSLDVIKGDIRGRRSADAAVSLHTVYGMVRSFCAFLSGRMGLEEESAGSNFRFFDPLVHLFNEDPLYQKKATVE
jgi:hypothetical protein